MSHFSFVRSDWPAKLWCALLSATEHDRVYMLTLCKSLWDLHNVYVVFHNTYNVLWCYVTWLTSGYVRRVTCIYKWHYHKVPRERQPKLLFIEIGSVVMFAEWSWWFSGGETGKCHGRSFSAVEGIEDGAIMFGLFIKTDISSRKVDWRYFGWRRHLGTLWKIRVISSDFTCILTPVFPPPFFRLNMI